MKSGKIKRFILTVVLLVLMVVVFILVGGGSVLRTTGKWISGVGKEADTVKRQMERKAATTGKAVEKVIETVKPEENKKDNKKEK